MFTSENDSRLANAYAVSDMHIPRCKINQRHLRHHYYIDYSNSKKIDTDNQYETSEDISVNGHLQRHLKPRSNSSNTSLSSFSKTEVRRKRKKKHKHHHRHRSNRANDVLQEAEDSPTAKPMVNPIFVWIKQEDTRIVQVLCEDYDQRNRIRLTKTATGWRSIPLTESLERCWHASASSSTTSPAKLLLVNESPSDNPQQTDKLSSSPHVGQTDKTQPSESLNQTVTECLKSHSDAFDSDESSQEDLRCIINKVQTNSLYSDDESVSCNRENIVEYTHLSHEPLEGSKTKSSIDETLAASPNNVKQSLQDTDNHSSDTCLPISTSFSRCDIVVDEACNDAYLHSISENEKDPLAVSLNTLDDDGECADSLVHINFVQDESSSLSSTDHKQSNTENLQSTNVVLTTTLPSIKVEKTEDSLRLISSTKSVLPEPTKEKLTFNSCNNEQGRTKVAPDELSINLHNTGQKQNTIADFAKNNSISIKDNDLFEKRKNSTASESINKANLSNDMTVVQTENTDLTLAADEVIVEDESENKKCASEKCNTKNKQLMEKTNRSFCHKNNVSHSNKSISCEIAEFDTTEPLSENNKEPYEQLNKSEYLQHSVKNQNSTEPIFIKTEKHDVENEFEGHPATPQRTPQLLRTPLCQTLRTTKLTPVGRRLQPTSKKLFLKNEPLPAHSHSASSQLISELGHDLSYSNKQDEPLDLGINCRMKISQSEKKTDELVREKISSPVSPFICRKRSSNTEKEIYDRRTIKKSRLLDLLTTKNNEDICSPHEEAHSDPLEQLKNVLANPKYSVPDPLLVPKARLSALVTCPGKEIPRLLARRAQDLSYFSILSDPDVLVVSLSHLQSLLKKPINEEEILKYQKQTEEIRSRLRQECFNNNYENMALGNWNQCYWLPSFQRSEVITSCDPAITPDLLSVLNIGYPPPNGTCCQEDSPGLPSMSNTGFDYHKQLQFQKEVALWQELAALHQLSTSSTFDHLNNNNIPANCNLNKDVYDLMWNHPDLCTNFGCYQPQTTLPSSKSNFDLSKPSINAAKCYPCDSQARKISIPFLPPCNTQPFSLQDNHSFDPLIAGFYSPTNIDHSIECSVNGLDGKYFDSYDSLRHMLTASENMEIHLKMQQHQPQQQQQQLMQLDENQTDENTHIKEERDSRLLQSSRSKEVKCDITSSRPVVPKIKVRKHLVDPNHRPTRLLNTEGHIFNNQSFPIAAATTVNENSLLWHPFFDR